MNEPIGPGDWVECVNAARLAPLFLRTGLHVGTIYQVRGIVRGAEHPSIWLEGVDNPDEGRLVGGWLVHGFRASRFRPIYRPDETLIARLMEPLPDAIAAAPERVLEPETA